ncbi:MAG: SRPBCC family protein [Gallionella sp.]
MATTHPSRNLSVSINRNIKDVYDFVCVPENFPRWASGLGKSLKRADGGWIAETQEGTVKVQFSERNEFGVLDHWVIPKPGLQIYVPMRVIPNGSGCELIFTLFRLPDMSDEQFAADAEWVMRDLTTLKNLLESR